jgi:hypothetical protein
MVATQRAVHPTEAEALMYLQKKLREVASDAE